MKVLCERIINTNEFAGRSDIITGIDDFTSQVEYDDLFHCYTLNGKILPSVTQLLDDGSYANVDYDILKYAQDKGTIVHEECQDYIEKGIIGFTKECNDFINLWEENKNNFGKAVIDIKTYSYASPDKRKKCYMQCKMYAEGIKHLTGEEITDYYMIWLPNKKDGKIFNLTKEFGGE